MDPRLLAKVAQWLVLNPRDERIQEEDTLGERTVRQYAVVVQTLSSEIKSALGLRCLSSLI